MGYAFEAKHTNLVSFVLDRKGKPPRSTKKEVLSFVRSLAEPTGDPRETLISGLDGEWQSGIQSTALKVIEALERLPDSPLPDQRCTLLLKPFREHFSGFALFSLLLVSQDDQTGEHEATKFFHEAARASGPHGLFLKPQGFSENLNFLDPLSAASALSRMPTEYPSVTFWTPKEIAMPYLKGMRPLPVSEAVTLGLEEGIEFYFRTLQPIFENPKGMFGRLFSAIRKKRSEKSRKTVLHLSDLHLGNKQVTAKRQYLKGALRSVCKKVDRVVLTGDVFDNPTSELRTEFDDFRSDLELFTKDNIILVPGNHDVRSSGNRFGKLGESYKAFSNLWQPTVVDHDMKAIFLCFDSCEEGSFARGRVSQNQRLAVASQIDALIQKSPECAEYTRIALVHHHPLPFDEEPEATALYQRVVQSIFPADQFVAFEDNEAFNRWCENRDVSLILHGHKHSPRQAWTDDGILVVGCGSTTGVEATPLCYDLVTLDPDTQAWSVAFYFDEHADGGGFRLQSVSLSAPKN